MGAAKETLQAEEKVVNALAPSNDSMVFEYLRNVTRLDGIFNFLLLCIHEEKLSHQLPCIKYWKCKLILREYKCSFFLPLNLLYSVMTLPRFSFMIYNFLYIY